MRNYFKDIVGQDLAIKILRSELSEDRGSHAYLFCGPLGCGKLNCAKAFAKSLEGDKFADLIESDSFIDLKIYEPMGVQTYLVSQIKEIVNDTVLAPIQGKKKIYILKNAESLGTAAANSFLKTLEEPESDVCFILLANNADNVLPTIASRCQIINFKQLPFDTSVEIVKTNSGALEDDCKNALMLFGGNTEKAIDFCLDQNLQDYYSEIVNVLDNLDSIDDWDCILRSADIVNKQNEIVSVYKNELEEKTKDLSEFLERSAISIIEDQNKRNVGSKQRELLSLFCAIIMLYYRNLIKETMQDKYIKRINCLNDFEQNLAYNISPQNFCDVVLLKIKRI